MCLKFYVSMQECIHICDMEYVRLTDSRKSVICPGRIFGYTRPSDVAVFQAADVL